MRKVEKPCITPPFDLAYINVFTISGELEEVDCGTVDPLSL